MTDASQLNHQDIVGKTAFDVDGDKVGEVEYCYLDLDTDLPEWVAVKTGKLTGKTRLVPLMDATMTDDGLHLAFGKAQIKEAPELDLDMDLTEAEEVPLFEHYGLAYSESQSDTGLPAGRSTPAPAGGDDAMTRSEEELQVGKVRREAGRARLRKYVVTENVTTTVPVQREEVRLEREPITEANVGAATAGRAISEDEHEVVLHEEEPVVTTRAVPKERVRLSKETVTTDEQVSADVRKEQIETEEA